MRTFTYSFEDVTVDIQHPDMGAPYSAYGTGIGEVSISMANEVSAHDIAADGSVVVSKLIKKNGTVNFTVLQSSDFNSWLKRYYNYVMTASPSKFALATIIIRSNSTGECYTCTGVSPQKLADDKYGSQSQNREWTLMAANIEVS